MIETLVIIYACAASLIGPGLMVNQKIDQATAEIRSAAVSPIVVPESQHIPWLTEKTVKACQDWALAHPDKKANCRP